MFNWRQNSDGMSLQSKLDALDRSQAVIEFKPDGTIVSANANFLNAMGYSLAEIQGKHHSMFVETQERNGAAYREFWADLNRGAYKSGEFKRVAKDGRDIWIQATYNPVLNRAGNVIRVIKFAADITDAKLRSLDARGKMEAIDRVQARIEFELDGTIISANENFLNAMGYSLAEIQGKHHRMFVEPADRDSAAYRELWADLKRGVSKSAEFKRIGKGGREVWILASYNPILDDTGKPFKVVKFASDVTEQKLQRALSDAKIAAVEKSQAVIEFDMDGTIRTANGNFLSTVGYSLSEIKGQHHSMFVEAEERNGAAYREFWASLNRGEYQAGEYRRIGRGGREVWIEASYNPILDLNGRPVTVLKYATDTTAKAVIRHKSENARGMIQSVAASSEEMSASIREISEAMSKSKDTAGAAVHQVGKADNQAQRLSAAAEAMGGIVEMIGSITGQINLLALNATIESARAGEAGRGFAVVASEVKNLATQAKQATDKITDEISALNNISGDVVRDLRQIRKAIEAVSEYVTTTAAAVEEQNVVTRDISSNMQRAAAELA
jgi:methyl-accepting chemotaxis protein